MGRSPIPPRTLPDALPGDGITWITTTEAAERLGIQPNQVPDGLERSRAAGRMRSTPSWPIAKPLTGHFGPLP